MRSHRQSRYNPPIGVGTKGFRPDRERARPGALKNAPRKDLTAALDDLIAEVKTDRSVLAAIPCGILAHDIVWEKSGIDLALITIDDRKGGQASLAMNASVVNVHALLLSRTISRTAMKNAGDQAAENI